MSSSPRNMQSAVVPIPTGNYVSDCFVERMVVSLHAKTADSTNFLQPLSGVFVSIDVCGSGIGPTGAFGGCDSRTLFAMNHTSPPSGNQIADGCGRLVFDDMAASAFNPPGNPPAPFVGTFRPAATYLGKGQRLNSSFELRASTGPATDDLELQCFSVTFITRTTPPTLP